MGIDIYLHWRGMTKNDHDKQITGFSVSDGHNGYLRAAYSNSEACNIFYELFDRKKWDSARPFKYDFKANYDRMRQLVNNCSQHPEWKKSLIAFFDLALTKENPRVEVSY